MGKVAFKKARFCAGMHSLTLNAEQFEVAIGQLQRYQSRYASRLKPENLQRVNQTLRVLR
jgi:hypothetical protein